MKRIAGIVTAIFETEEEMSAYLATRRDSSEIARVSLLGGGEIVTADKIDYPCMALVFELEGSSFIRICTDVDGIESAWGAFSIVMRTTSILEINEMNSQKGEESS